MRVASILRNHEVMHTFCFLKTESYHRRARFLKSWLYSLSLKKRLSVALRERDDYPVILTYKQHPHILQYFDGLICFGFGQSFSRFFWRKNATPSAIVV